MIILNGRCNNYQHFKAVMSINENLIALTMDVSVIVLMNSISITGIANTTALLPTFKIEGNAKD